ncbi:hypothetical protein GOP47_0021965 [Adiantum capillus-veneris]|uniref:Uncharacterized protein n=1 Tax=Adiantum capillus-veneris TaxID=13818 RepID=A0A9D4U8H4_ADICA|nr:hypothetical protein GOP47_0021965 [Adiantum capillus-veneris]
MSQKPVIIATKTVSGEIHVCDYTMHPPTPFRGQQPWHPYLRLGGHIAEGYGLAWSARKEGYLLSGSTDARICLVILLRLQMHLLIWDHRASTEPIQTVKVNDKSWVNCLAFEPVNKELVVVGFGDGTLALHDLHHLSQPLHELLTHELPT